MTVEKTSIIAAATVAPLTATVLAASAARANAGAFLVDADPEIPSLAWKR